MERNHILLSTRAKWLVTIDKKSDPVEMLSGKSMLLVLGNNALILVEKK